MKDNQPYYVFTKHRPLKVVYIISDKAKPIIFDEIERCKSEAWGGTYHPILSLKSGCLPEKSIQFLEAYDPEVILFLSKPLKKCLEILNNRLNPYFIEYIQPKNRNRLYTQISPISSKITYESLLKFNIFPHSPDELIQFDLKDLKSKHIMRFIERNFGIFEWNNFREWEVKYPKVTVLKVNDINSLNKALKHIGTYGSKIFKNQILAQANFLPDVKYDHKNEGLKVIIGDTPLDSIYFENQSILTPHWLRNKITRLWIPLGLAVEPVIRNGLRDVLRIYSDGASHNRKDISFLSSSLDKDSLNKISADLGSTTRRRIHSVQIDGIKIPNFKTEISLNHRLKNMVEAKCYSSNEKIMIDRPEVIPIRGGNEHWATEIIVKSPYLENQALMLPPRGNKYSRYFDTPYRIQKSGFPTLIQNWNGSSEVNINLSPQTPIFRSLILGGNHYQQGDLRKDLKQMRFYKESEPSDKGLYLTGVIKAFGSLDETYEIFKSNFWREAFNQFANNKKKNLQFIEEQLTVRINKYAKTLQSESIEKCGEWLTNEIQKTAANIAKNEQVLSFKEFQKIAEKEISEFNSTRREDDKILFDKINLQNRISNQIHYLIEKNIIISGFVSKCPLCSHKNWKTINEISRKIICNGCNHTFITPPETTWKYKLNNLVRESFLHHGITPLILALGELKKTATSFQYSPNLNLYKSFDRTRNDAEIDLVCIKDNEFIIGEVKENNKLFKRKDFIEMVNIGIHVKADVVLFSTMQKPSRKLYEYLKEAQEIGKPYGIKVQWLLIPKHVLDSWPIV